MGNINNICNVIKLDKHTHSVVTPTLLLKNRKFDVIGEIANFDNWSISFRGDNIDEISFDVHKYFQKISSENDSTTLEKNPLWNRIVDLAIVDFVGYGLFEIDVTINEADTTIKSVVGQSLEVELGQTNLHDFHVNDDDTTGQIDYNDDYVIDDEGNVNFVPTVFCNFEDTKHSLLHRAIEKCPQWSIGHVPEYIAVNKKDKPEASFKFQRSYTVDGTSIYDFLVGDVAKESNVIFIFDTYNRKINCYNLEDYTWVSDDGKETIEIDAIGNDTTILIDGNNLVNDSTLSTNKDSIKNCFRVLGGDDYINAMVAVCNMTGDNYIYKFGSDQLEDMGKELSTALSDYNNLLESCQDEYYSSNTEKITIGDKEYDIPIGIFTKLAYLTDLLYEKQDTMMPGLVTALPENHVAKDEYDSMVDFFRKYGAGVFSLKDYSDTAFSGVTNNILSIAKIAIDARYTIEIVDNSASYNSKTFKWSGKFKIYRTAKQEDIFVSGTTTINVTDDSVEYSKQKCLKALAKTEISEVDFNVAEMNTQQRYEYFNKFALNRLKSFSDAYNSCLSILTDLKQKNGTGASLYDEYYLRYTIINDVMKVRQVEVDDINKLLNSTRELQSAFFEKVNLKKFLENKSTDTNLYNLFCAYRREDDYQNDNYISDGLTDAECIEKAKELLDVAKEEINTACEPNRTISENINNIFTISDFEKLYDKFSLYNYIRAEVDDEIYKLRILDIEFNSESPETLNVTFAENIESIDGTISESQDAIIKANGIATSYSSTMLQAKNGNEANKNIKSIYKNGLCATSALLKNSDDGEVEFSQSGIICKQITDDDDYSLKQLRMTYKGIYLTEDNWENLSEAIGEIAYTDPITGENKIVYGVIADSIVGNFLASEKVYIGNTSGSVIIDSDGIEVTNGSLCIADNNYSVEIDPKHKLSDKTLDNYLLCIRNKTDNNVVMGVNTSGNAYFNGEIMSQAGRIGSLDIGTNKLSFKTESIRYKNLNKDVNGYYYLAKYTRYCYSYSLTSSATLEKTDYLSGKMYYDEENSDFIFSSYDEIDKYISNLHDYEPSFSVAYVDENGIYYNSDGFFMYVIRLYVNVSYKNIVKHVNSSTGLLYYTYDVYHNIEINLNNYEDSISYSVLYEKDCKSDTNPSLSPEGGSKYYYEYDFTDMIDSVDIEWAENTFEISDDSFAISNCLTYNGKTNSLQIHDIDSNVTPFYDNGYDVGTAQKRWRQIYSASSVISTSDKTKKKNISYDIDKYVKLFDLLKPCQFQFIDGESGRFHIGYIAQDVENAMHELNMSSVDFAGLCKDKLDDGTVLYSLRYDEFQGIYDAKIKQLENRVNLIEEKLNSLISSNNDKESAN